MSDAAVVRKRTVLAGSQKQPLSFDNDVMS